MNLFIKSLEWICDNKSIFKLESINAYLQDLISKERIQTDLGWIDIGIEEKSDIQYVQEESSIIISDKKEKEKEICKKAK